MVERSSRSRPTTFKTKLPRCFSLERQERREAWVSAASRLCVQKLGAKRRRRQSRIAELLSVSPSFICFIETGRCTPSSHLLSKIVSVTGDDFVDLASLCQRSKRIGSAESKNSLGEINHTDSKLLKTDDECWALANRLKQWRADNGFSRRLVANVVGMTPSHVGAFEAFNCRPSLLLFNKISAIVGLSPSDSKRLKESLFKQSCSMGKTDTAVISRREHNLKQPLVHVTNEQWDSLRVHLKSWRKQNGIRQFQIAQMLGVSSGHISNVETGKHRPSNVLYEKILAMFGSSMIESAKSCASKTHPQTIHRPKHVFRIGLPSKQASSATVQVEKVVRKKVRGGDQVRQLRRLNGLTQKRLSELLGVGRLYVSQIENGVRALSYNTAKKIVDLSASGQLRLPENRLFEIFVEDKEGLGVSVVGHDQRPYRDFGEKVQSIRRQSGKAVGEFANDLGISVFALQLIEDGWSDASVEVLVRLRDVFAADVNWLLGSEGSEAKISNTLVDGKAKKNPREKKENGRAIPGRPVIQFDEGNA